jgi:hypothetical protein
MVPGGLARERQLLHPLGRFRCMTDKAEKRGQLIQLIRHLEEALSLADEIEDGQTGFLIVRVLDEARSRQFRPTG